MIFLSELLTYLFQGIVDFATSQLAGFNLAECPHQVAKIENFTEFFCRRFKLLEVGMQLKLKKSHRNGKPREETLFLSF